MPGKKVLHIVSVSFSLRYFIGNQFHYFKERGYEFHVACSASTELNELSEEFGFKVFPVPILRSIDPIQDLSSILKLRQYIKKEKFDIVIAHSPKGGLIGMLAAYLAHTPKRIFFRHGLVFETSSGFKKHLLIGIERLISNCAHHVVDVSPSVARVSQQLKLTPATKSIILGRGSCNGVDVARFKHRQGYKQEGIITIGFVGRLSIDKGIVDLVEAWQLLKTEYGNIRLLLVGPLDERDGLDSGIIKQIQEDTTIIAVGGVTDTAVYYNKMDIFVLPSYREGLPTVTLEASASRLPIVTTRVTGCIDSIIEHKTGIFADNTAISLFEAIKFYLDHIDIAMQHGLNGEKFVHENFSEQQIYNEIEKCY